ncbi:MAG: hypothetical protein A2Z04_07935 [Chloroflexi bacterium RBG_16_57_9]|nr:MAG: hypothetical protein A2Z04_07935 [Chloroflexi bacterium RBG_16_57_9]
MKEIKIPVGVSGRHVHLCRADIDVLFGQGYELKVLKDLYQPGYFAAHERLLVVGRKRCLEEVRVLGPLRPKSQVELSQTEAIFLGLDLELAESGADPLSKPILLVGPKGQVQLPGSGGGGAYIARRHVHMNQSQADDLGLKEGDRVDVRVDGPRALTLHGVVVRIRPEWRYEIHLDTDESNASGVRNGDMVTMIVP